MCLTWFSLRKSTFLIVLPITNYASKISGVSMRRLTVALTSTIMLLGLIAGNSISPNQSVAASEVPCIATATGRVVNSTGTAVYGDIFFQVVAENLGTPYLSNFRYGESSAANGFQFCFDAELDSSLYSEDGTPGEAQYAPDLTFAAGDVIRISVSVESQEGSATYQEISLTSAQASALNSGSRTVNLGDIQVASQSQFAILLKNEDGSIVSNAQWHIGRSYAGESRLYTGDLMILGLTDNNGRINAAGLPDGDYGMRVDAPWDTNLGYVGKEYFFTISSGNVTWISATDSTPLSLTHLVLPTGNLRLNVQMPDGSPLTLEETFRVRPEVWKSGSNTWYESQPQSGGIVALVDVGETYRVELNVEGSEGRLSGLLGGSYEVSVTEAGTTVVGTTSNVVKLKEANLSLIPSSGFGNTSSFSTFFTAATGACIELTLDCINSLEERGGISAGIASKQGNAGEISFVLPLPNDDSPQDYWVSFDPNGEFAGVSKTARKLTATNVNDSISFSSESGISWVGSKGTVLMESPNFKVRTFATNSDGTRGAPLQAIRVSTNRSDELGNESIWHYFNASTNALGESGGLLLDSTYYVYFEPRSERVAKTASAINFEVVLAANGEITMPNLPDYLSSNVTVTDEGILEVELPRPNVLGNVVTPDGDSDPYANIGFENQAQGCQADDCSRWFNVDSQGRFAGYLKPGLYTANVSPSWRTQDTFASNSTDFLLEPSGEMCSGSNVDKVSIPNLCLSDETSSLEFSLAVPNLSGVVKAGAVPVDNNGGIRIEKFRPNTSQIENGEMVWVNVDSNGRYRVNIQEAGSYQLIFDSVEGLDGYTATKEYFVASGNSADGFEFCKASKPIGNKEPVCSASTTSAPFTLDVDLNRSNLMMRAIETDEASFDWAYGWAQTMSSGMGSTNEYVNFSFSRNTNIAYLNLGEIGTVKKYKISIDFGKNDGSSIKKNLVLWAANFDNDAETMEFCLDKHYISANSGVDPLCRNLNLNNVDAFISALDQLEVVVSAGVFRGVVSTPEVPPKKVRFAQVQVKKWTENSWGNAQNRQGWWQWTDNYSSTDREGRYSLDITTPGVYLVEAQTPWGSDDYPYAQGENVIRVTNETGDEAAICEYANKAKDGDLFDFDFGTCGTVGSSGIDTRFKVPNLTGTVSWAGTTTTDAWVNGYALKTVSCGEGCTYVSRTWIRLQMNDSGQFFGSLEPGDYEAEAVPNDRLSGLAVKSKVDFSINAEGQLTQNGAQVNELNISLAEPNIRGTICTMGSTAPCLPAEWTHVSVTNMTDWSYNYANTNEEGKFSLLLDLGEEYQFRLYPSDSQRQGTNSTFSVEVFDDLNINNADEIPQCSIDGGTTINCSELLMALSAPNVKGTMMYEVVSGQPTSTPWSWISVWSDTQNQNFWTGTSTNSSGEFALALPKEVSPGTPRTYSATAYFYGIDEQRAPLDFQIRGEHVAGVGNGPSTTRFTWKYPSQTGWAEIPIVGMTPNFDFVQPNSKITLAGVPNDGKRVIRIVSGSGLSEKIYRVTTSGNASNNFAEVNLPKNVLANVRVVPEVGETFVGCYQKTIMPADDPGGIQTQITINVSTSCN